MYFEIINHCHRYDRLLAYQLSCLIRNCPKPHKFRYVLYVADDDEDVVKIFNFFKKLCPSNVEMIIKKQRLSQLKQRAIGRNASARRTKADWIWFTDTDYVWNDKLWEGLESSVERTLYKMVWPRYIRETSWDDGEALIEKMAVIEARSVPIEISYRKKMIQAIGGVQFVHGRTANRVGYCPSLNRAIKKWDFSSDVHFRKNIHPKSGIDMYYVMRIRHKRKGYQAKDGNFIQDGEGLIN